MSETTLYIAFHAPSKRDPPGTRRSQDRQAWLFWLARLRPAPLAQAQQWEAAHPVDWRGLVVLLRSLNWRRTSVRRRGTPDQWGAPGVASEVDDHGRRR